MQERRFDSVEVGDEFTERIQPTAGDVQTFFALTNPGRADSRQGGRFSDSKTARSEGLARPIVPGNMSLGLLTRLVTDWMGGSGKLRMIDVNYRRPVLHDDELNAVCLVTHTDSEGGAGVVELDVYLENQRGERPLQGAATVELPLGRG